MKDAIETMRMENGSGAVTTAEMINLNQLRMSQDFADQIGVKKAILTVPVRKPDRQWFVQVHPGEAYRMPVGIIEVKEDRAHYVVDPGIACELPGEVIVKQLFTAMNRQGNLFLWPIRLPGVDGRLDDWNRLALEAASIAMKKWIRIVANMAIGTYDIYEATGELAPPEWPELTFEEIFTLAFKDRVVRGLDHPVIRRLRGEI